MAKMAVDLVHRFVDTFWAESFWLPSNHTWSEIIAKRESGQMYLPLPRDLWAPFPIAIVLLIVRLLFERFIALPIGQYYNIRETHGTKPVHNDVLQQAFEKYGKHPPGHDVLVGIAKQADWSVRSVERWWRRQRAWTKPPGMQKFKETSWRFFFYIVTFWSGLVILYQKNYFWDTHHCWYNYPWHPVPNEIYWYFMTELGFYWSLVLSLFMDVKRKDFVEMIIHHVVTIALLSFAWGGGMVRIAVLVIVVHDAVDYWMEGAKLAKYCKYHKLCDVLFIIFTIVWFITRIVIYPLRFIKSILFESSMIVGYFPAYYVFSALHLTLQVLHIIWFYMILRMVYSYIIVGKVEKDGRSDTELETNSEDDDIIVKKTKEVEKEYQVNGTQMMNNNKSSRNSIQAQKRKQ